jgi:hypothetical protein
MRVVQVALLALLLAGCGAVSEAQYTIALRRWQSRPVDHYLLRTYEEIRGRRCAQAVEVRDEQLVRIVSNTCQHTLWTVSWLFTFASGSSEAFSACALLVPGVGCVCRYDTEVRATYDAVSGYPRQIHKREVWRVDWQSAAYWRYLATRGQPPTCTPPAVDPGRRVVVRELRPLP